jgi:cytidylate kinase
MVNSLIKKLQYNYVDEKDIIYETSHRFNISEKKLCNALYNKAQDVSSRLMAYIQLVIAEHVIDNNMLYYGFSAHLIPQNIAHVLKVCVIGDYHYRIQKAISKKTLTYKDALNQIKNDDNTLNLLTQYLYQKNAWDYSLYDILIPIDKISVDAIVNIISENISKGFIKTTEDSKQAVEDFLLFSKINVALNEKGYNLNVICNNGQVKITTEKTLLRPEKFKEEISRIVYTVEGVTGIQFTTSPDYESIGYYSRFNITMPVKTLSMDDEKDFTLTLSKRLQASISPAA